LRKIEGETKIGKGPVVTYAPAVQNNLRELILDTAEEKKIPFQRLASSRVTEHGCICVQQWWCGFGFDFASFALHAYHCRNGAP
jgi:putative aminopeptidase FrvX